MADIQIQHIYKSSSGKPVLANFSALLPDGSVTAIMAPSGQGKTTLLRLLMGLEQPDKGSITGLDGMRISPVFQENRLCEYLPVSANLRLTAPQLTDGNIREALGQVCLPPSCAGQPVLELSGGMKRRVAILRALLTEHDLLLLDEPFQGLDSAAKAAVITLIRQKSKGKTLVLVTHDKQEAIRLGAQKWVTLI